MKSFSLIIAFALLACAYGQSINECLEKDSISCIQKSLYRKAREFFDKESLEIVSGVSLVKSNERSAKSGKELVYDQEIDQSLDVAHRQTALESFIGEEVSEFFNGRSLRINFSPIIEKIGDSARALSDSVPKEYREAVDDVVEARGKKKSLKKLIPLLLLAKAKIGLLATLAYFGIALLAKKAIFVSIISIAISAFIGLKSLWDKKSGGGHDASAFTGGWSTGGSSGYSSGGGWASGTDDSHGGYSAHSQAYSGYH
ncbi:hypothetical protein QAD02_020134 [Eretmocerus hayati]|uniref:Uncharacterized protein n=1 Tax=Eretmocerus hayati TaxID=131215 RepID=A0ACC2PPR7_9HYME|nr:hypothetical protein QAD02_020134 [Eretmocerus hayati]